MPKSPQPFRGDVTRLADRAATARSAAAPASGRVDATDAAILGLLEANARLPLKSIAGSVGLARSSVRDRITRLEAAGIIVGYHARVAADERLSALLSVTLDETPSPKIVAAVTAMPEVRRCYSLSGPVALAVEIEAATPRLLNAARDRIALLPGVARVVTAMILNRDKDI